MQRVIQEVVGSAALLVEHIGSTSIPQLAAKPVVDVVMVVEEVTDEDLYVAPLVGAGFNLRRREPGHRLFRSAGLDVNIHVLQEGDPAIADYLAFRDHLREHAAGRERYAELKRSLAQQEWSSMTAYADAKTDFVQEVLVRAGSER